MTQTPVSISMTWLDGRQIICRASEVSFPGVLAVCEACGINQENPQKQFQPDGVTVKISYVDDDDIDDQPNPASADGE